MKNISVTLNALYRTNFGAFTLKLFEVAHGKPCDDNWHLWAMAYQLQRCTNGDVTRLMIAIGPRYLKSFMTSIAWPLWILGRDPTAKIICVSYSDVLAETFSKKRRDLMEDPRVQKIFPNLKIDKTKNTIKHTYTSKAGEIFTTSIGGTLTGFGCDYLIIDDPIKPKEAMSESERKTVNDWFHNTAYSRLNNKNTGRIVIISQRVHSDDLIGHLLELDEDEWTFLFIPAIESEWTSYPIGAKEWYDREPGEPLHAKRESLAILEGIKKSVGSYIFETQYQQNPAPPGGALFKKKWLRRYPNAVSSEKFDSIVDSWDTAAGTGPNNAYSCCTTWGIAGATKVRQPDPDLCRLIATARNWFDQLASGDAGSVKEIAECEEIFDTEITRILPLAFLAPSIIENILNGRQPETLTVKSLKRINPLPTDWNEQQKRLGFHQ